MEALNKETSKTGLGLPPGTVVYTGEKKKEKVKILVMDYDESKFEERWVDNPQDCIKLLRDPTVTWIHVTGVHDIKKIEGMGEAFGLHPLVMEDIANTEQRPKMDDYEDYLFIVCKMIFYDRKGGIRVEQVSLVIGKHYVMSFHEKEEDVFELIRNRIRNGKGRTRRLKSDWLGYALLDAIVDNYFVTLEKIGEEIEQIEAEVVRKPTTKTIGKIHKLKRDLIFLRKSIWPLREVVSSLQRTESKLVKKNTKIYLKDLHDHTVQVMDMIETYRDVLSGMMDVYLSSISNRMNEIMKVLTVISTIFIPLTFLTSLYGMNFHYMPELSSPLGYPLLWLVLITVALVMVAYFRRKKWI